MRKLFTTLILLGVVVTVSAEIKVEWNKPGTDPGTLIVEYKLTRPGGEADPNAVGEFARKYENGNLIPPLLQNQVKGNVKKLILKGEGFTNEDFNGGKMGDFIKDCAGEGNTLYLDLTDASGLISKVNYTTTATNPVKDATYQFTNEKENKPVEKKTLYEYEDGTSFTGDVNDLVAAGGNEYTYSTEEWLLDGESYSWQEWQLNNLNSGTYNQNGGTWNDAYTEYTYTSWDNGSPVEHKITKATVTKTVKSRTVWGYTSNEWPFPFIEVAETEVEIDSNDPTKGTIEVLKDGTAFAFGYVDQNGRVQQNYCGNYINGITFPKGDNFTAIPDKLCCTALCPNLETVVWGDQLEWIGADAFRGGVKGYDNNDNHYSPASELKKIGTMDAQGNVTFPTITLTEEEGELEEGVVTFPSTLKVIGMDAFYECKDFRYVNLDLDNLVKVDAAAFNMYQDDINHLDSVQMPSKVNSSLKFWGNQVFSSSHIKTLDFTYCEGITNFAYDGMSSMEEGTWTNPGGANSEGANGENTFYWYQDLQTLILPPNLKYISGGDQNKSIARQCSSLTTVIFTGKPIFENCEITNGLVITSQAFLNCPSLTTVDLSDNITKIETEAFTRTGLTEISIPASVQTIERHAFTEMGSLTKVIFEDIPEDANCQACKDEYVATTVKSGAFQEATKVKDVYINNTSVDLICENEAFNRGTTFGHGNTTAPLAILHFPEGKEEHYTQTDHFLTNEIAMNPKKFHEWLVEHFNLASIPKKNGWYEFVNAGPSSPNSDLVFDGDVILRTFSDYHYARIVPEGLRAYIVNKVEQKTIIEEGAEPYNYFEATLQRLMVIPAQTGVILYGQPNSTNADGTKRTLMMPITYFKPGDNEGKALRRENWDLLDAAHIAYKNYLEPLCTEDGSTMRVEHCDWELNDEGEKVVTFRNFALNRMDQTKNLRWKVDNFSVANDNYVGFFRILKGNYDSGYAYLHLAADEYDQADGAEVIVKADYNQNNDPDYNGVPYFMEYNKDGDTYNPLNLVDDNGNSKNFNHYWEFAQWDERTRNWGTRGKKFNIQGAVSFLGEFEDDTDGIVKLVIPANNANDEYYTLQGVKVMKPTKGVYIHNGKKVVIK